MINIKPNIMPADTNDPEANGNETTDKQPNQIKKHTVKKQSIAKTAIMTWGARSKIW